MTDFSEQQNNHINRPDLQNSTPQRTTSNKRPLLAANINSLRNIRNNNNNNNNNCTSGVGKIQQQQTSLSEESIRNNVQIVLNNIQRNAAKQQQMLKSGSMMGSPESDFNSNLYLGATTTATAGMLGCSIASSHDFTHDNSDYQWFLDYGYRDGITHQSVLSSLSASYNGIGELSYYEDLAKNIDANLAEVDMESFRTEDIHSLLTNTIPTLCHKKQPGSMTDNANKCKRNLDLDNSICKSELLFSPVRESHISVDSLDMDGYPNEDDIILTCQANKDNYTIAFEGSVMYSDESYYDGPEFTQKYKQQQSMNLMQLENIVRKKAMEQSMSRSDNHGLTTWSKLRKNSSQQQLPSRCPSRNNNIQANHLKRHLPHCFVHKSSSMPNLKATQQQPPLNVSQAISNSSVDSYGKLRSLLPMYQMPISTSDNDDGHHHHQHSTSSNEHQNQSTDMGACDIDNQQQKTLTQEQQQQQQQHLQPSFNLVKLFIKQKSSSTDTCMDVSSGCWPSDSTNSSSGDNNTSSNNNNNNNNYLNSNMNNQQQHRLRKKSMNDSGKGSALSRHDEEELRRHHEHELRKALEGGADDDYPFDSLDAQINNPQRQVTSSGKETNDFNREVFDSPSRRQKKNYREFNIIRNQIKNPIVFNLMNNNSISHNSFKDTTSDTTMSRTSENLTQIFNSNSSKTTTKIPIEMLTKSMQTSTSAFVNTATAVAAAAASTKEKYRIVPPSFLAQLKGEEQKAPVFVIYPNYALPDLAFLKQQQPSEVILSPLSFKEPFSMKNKHHHQQSQHKRPFSMNATDNFYLNRQEYKHVKDWPSLMTLLPREYRKLLKNIPECQEANKTMMDASMSSQKPIFCMTPPIRRGCGVGNSRPISCDCVSILTQTNNYSGSSSGESSSQPPSSGYRGSSTILTDSELEGGGLGSNSSLKNMYVYQYEASGNDENNHPPRPPSGRHQRGILRRTNTNIRLPPAKGGTSGAGKRNSMFEDTVLQGMTVAEKRRSLQDPYYMTDTYNIIEDFIAETNAELAECDQQQLTQGHGGLPNYPKQRDSDKFNTTKQQLRDFDLNKAVTNKLNAEKEDLAARMRAENFLTSVPKSELKHYAEVASLLESIIDDSKDISTIDCSKLRNVVSRALSSQKRVSFDGQENIGLTAKQCLLRPNELHFTTPPNSPNMSTIHNNQNATAKGLQKKQLEAMGEKEKQDKVACNRFKRLQIQWELLSKESAALAHDMQNNGECPQFQAQRDTKSGGNTPVGHNAAPKSRIPRPVSYPTSKGTPEHTTPVKTLRSPSRMVPPKKYSAPTPTPAPRTPSKQVHTTPKKTASISRTVSRTR